jgi:hypothetical protein
MTRAAPLFLFLALLAALAAYAVLAQSTGEDCRGEYGDGTTVYDLTPLAALLGSQEVITTDPYGQVYYYKVCGSVRNTFCQSEDDTTPAVCRRTRASLPSTTTVAARRKPIPRCYLGHPTRPPRPASPSISRAAKKAAPAKSVSCGTAPKPTSLFVLIVVSPSFFVYKHIFHGRQTHI